MKNKKSVKIYPNAENCKPIIYKENKGKSGIYMWTNLITGKFYIGSSIDLGRRLRMYYSLKTLRKALLFSKSNIYKAILKHSYYNFKLEILEYITFPIGMSTKEKKQIILEKEQFYIKSLKPQYNILTNAGSRLGSKSTFETKKSISIGMIRGKNPKVHMVINNKIIKSETKLKLSLNNKGVCVKIYDKSDHLIKEFLTINSAAKYRGVSPATISRIYQRGISYDNYIYKFEVRDIRIWIHNEKNQLIEIFENTKLVSKQYNIPRCTLNRYVKSSKLYKNKYYFYNHESKPNI